jgi:hypothetical protein
VTWWIRQCFLGTATAKPHHIAGSRELSSCCSTEN